MAGLALLIAGAILAQAQLPGLWTPLPPVPLPAGTGLADHSATLLADGTILIAGGESAEITPIATGAPGLSAANLYQPSQNGWFPLPNMASDRASHGAAVLANGTSVLVAGGYNMATTVAIANLGGGGNCGLQGPSGGAGADLGFGSTNAELFDETTFGWTVVASMNSPRAEFTLVRLPDGRILAPAGSWKDQTAEIFDPTANTWSFTGGMNAQRAGAATTRLFDGRVFVAGGNFGYNVGGIAINCPTDAEVYDPSTNSWSGAGGMSKNHYHATATEVRVADGTRRVLVAGGFDGDDSNLAVLQTTELWDPSTNSFTQAAPMLSPRAFHTATLLPSGQVLVTGGVGGVNTRIPLNTTEIYDPVANTWTAAQNLSVARVGHTATLELGPGPTKVVVVGGISINASNIAEFVSSAELFQPTPISSNVSLFPTQTLSGTFNESSCSNPGVQAFVTSGTGIGTPTGQVSFTDGGTPVGTLALVNGGALLNVPPLSLGTHTLQATYNGDSAFTAATSQVLTQQVVPPPVQVTGPPTSNLGSVVTLVAAVPEGATSPFNFTWTPPSGTLLSPTCPTPTYCGVPPSLGPNVFTVTGTDATGCHLATGSFTVNVLPTHFGISVPSSVVAGVPFNLTLTALDSSNRVDTTYTGSAHFTSTDPLALPAPDYTFFPADAGVHIFLATLKTVGTQTITATDTAFASITGTSGPIQVNAPPPDFSLKATSPITVKVGGFENATITVTSLNAFNSPVTLSTSNLPSGVTTTFSANPITPPSGGSASSTLTVTIGPSVTPTTFTFTVTGTSGALTHSAQITVAVTATPVGVAAVIANMAATTTCIDNSGVSNALSSKLSAAQSSISAGDVQSAINTLTALKNQIQAQAAKHIATSCSTGGVSYNPASTLLIDVQNLIDTTRTNSIADPITGYVLDPNGVPVSGAIVSLLDSGGNTMATAATDVTGFYYFATTGVLSVTTNYSVQVTGFAGFTVATPSAQPFTWQGTGLTFSFSVN